MSRTMISVFFALVLSALGVSGGMFIPAEAYQNPLQVPDEVPKAGIADPGVLRWMGRYYLYATKPNNDPGIRCWESKDMVNWKYKGYCIGEDEAFEKRMAWQPTPFYYNGKFYLYTCGPDHRQSVFVSDQPEGPFTLANRDVVSVRTLDASPFLDDDGQLYLFYAGGGENGVQYSACSSPIFADGPNQKLPECRFSVKKDNYWVEGPEMIKIGGMYYLIYCGNDWLYDNYQIRAAKGRSIPELKPQKNNPIVIQEQGEWVAVGCGTFALGPDLKSLWVLYHSRKKGATLRRLCLDLVHIDPDTEDMFCEGPSWEPRPNPSMPTWYEDFGRGDFGISWKPLSGTWELGNGYMTGGSPEGGDFAEIAIKCPASAKFNAELNLKLVESRAGSGGFGFGAVLSDGCEDGLLVWIDAETKTLEIRSRTGGRTASSPLAKAALPGDFDMNAWHRLFIEKTDDRLRVYFDSMLKADIESDFSGREIRLAASGCRAAFGWCGFSNL